MKYRKLEGYKYDLVERYELWLGKDLPTVLIYKYLFIQRDRENARCKLVIMEHYAWDGPSGLALDTKDFMRGSLVHDALYQLMREEVLGRKYRKYADQLLRKICLQDGMGKFRAWYVYRAVRMFAKKSSMPRKKPRGEIVEI